MIGVGFFQIFTLTIIFAASQFGDKQWLVVCPLPFITATIWVATQRYQLPMTQFMSRNDEYDGNIPLKNLDNKDSALELHGLGSGIITSKDQQVDNGVGLGDLAFHPALVKVFLYYFKFYNESISIFWFFFSRYLRFGLLKKARTFSLPSLLRPILHLRIILERILARHMAMVIPGTIIISVSWHSKVQQPLLLHFFQ